jgi:uncharacterized protein (DUF58 family)
MDTLGSAALKPAAPRRAAERFSQWIFKPRGPERGTVVLEQRRVFIFPTRYGLFFAASLLVFLAASINYDLALGFVLTFYLASAGLVAMLHTFRNQVRLELAPVRAGAVHAGEDAQFEVRLTNRRDSERAAIWLTTPQGGTAVDLGPHETRTVTLAWPARVRGVLAAPRITIDTRYPLSLFRAWSYWQPDLEALVYPRLGAGGVRRPDVPGGSGDGAPAGAGTEDFAGLRDYQSTDNPRHIAWKAAAVALETGAPLKSKQFTGTAAVEARFDYDALPAHMDREMRLSLLARWVVDAANDQATFTLGLPGRRIGPAAGDAHRRACLEALALFDPLPGGA